MANNPDKIKEARYFSHDSNARIDDKILALRMKHGWAGYGLFWAIIEKLRESTDYTYPKDYEIIAYDLRSDTGIIKSIIEDFGLFEISDKQNIFFSKSLIRRMAVMDDKKAKKQLAGSIGAAKRWQNDSNAIAVPYQADSNAIADGWQNIAKESKVKESKVKEIKKNERKEETATPDGEPSFSSEKKFSNSELLKIFNNEKLLYDSVMAVDMLSNENIKLWFVYEFHKNVSSMVWDLQQVEHFNSFATNFITVELSKQNSSIVLPSEIEARYVSILNKWRNMWDRYKKSDNPFWLNKLNWKQYHSHFNEIYYSKIKTNNAGNNKMSTAQAIFEAYRTE